MTPTRIIWHRLWGKAHRHRGAIERPFGTLIEALHPTDAVSNETRDLVMRLLVFTNGSVDRQTGEKLYTLAMQDKLRYKVPYLGGGWGAAKPNSHLDSIITHIMGEWIYYDRLNPNEWQSIKRY